MLKQNSPPIVKTRQKCGKKAQNSPFFPFFVENQLKIGFS